MKTVAFVTLCAHLLIQLMAMTRLAKQALTYSKCKHCVAVESMVRLAKRSVTLRFVQVF